MDHVRLGRLLLRNEDLRKELLEAVRSERGDPRWARLPRIAGAACIGLLIAMWAILRPESPAPSTTVPLEATAAVPVVRSRWSYDFQDASQGATWEYVAHLGARARAGYGMHLEDGGFRLTNGEAVHLVPLGGRARIAATVWQDSSPASPCFGLFAGPISWAVVSDDSTLLRPRAGGEHVRLRPFSAPAVGTRLRLEMTITDGRVVCTVDGQSVFDEPVEGREPIEVGVFAFRDTQIGFDDVVVEGLPAPDPAPASR